MAGTQSQVNQVRGLSFLSIILFSGWWQIELVNSLLIVVFIFMLGLGFIFIFRCRDQHLIFNFLLLFFSTKVSFLWVPWSVVHASSNSMWYVGIKSPQVAPIKLEKRFCSYFCQNCSLVFGIVLQSTTPKRILVH